MTREWVRLAPHVRDEEDKKEENKDNEQENKSVFVTVFQENNNVMLQVNISKLSLSPTKTTVRLSAQITLPKSSQ